MVTNILSYATFCIKLLLQATLKASLTKLQSALWGYIGLGSNFDTPYY